MLGFGQKCVAIYPTCALICAEVIIRTKEKYFPTIHNARRESMMKKFLLFSLLALLSLLPTTNAIANSAPPPSVVWFTLLFETQPPPRLMGIQLIGCPTDQCTQPVLFHQFGLCEAPGCLSSPVTLSGFSTSFGCAANQCRATSFNAYGGIDFKLVAQFSDQVRSSPVTSKLPSGYGEVAAWNVIVGASDLSITPDTTIPTISEPYELFRQDMAVIGLSILVELVAAGAGFYIWARTDWLQWLKRLLVVFLVNLATLPAVWLFIPTFGQFQSASSRNLGLIAIIVSAFYVAGLIVIYRSPRKVRLWAIPVMLVAGLLTGFGCTFLLMMAYYGGRTVYVQGLPPTLVILVSELFAVITEAVLISILCNLPLKTRWIWMTSLLMNTASFVAGQLLIGR